MAATPLFIDSTATVQKRLRLTGVPAGTDAEALIEEALRIVRVGFFRELTTDRITVLINTPPNENPSNEAEVLRSLAEITELKWIRYELMRTIPTLYADSMPSAQTAWNNEGTFRGTTPTDREYELKRLMADIEQAWRILTQLEQIPDETTMAMQTFVGVCQPRPGDSLRVGVLPGVVSTGWQGWLP